MNVQIEMISILLTRLTTNGLQELHQFRSVQLTVSILIMILDEVLDGLQIDTGSLHQLQEFLGVHLPGAVSVEFRDEGIENFRPRGRSGGTEGWSVSKIKRLSWEGGTHFIVERAVFLLP